jgi:hypothetical protein
MPFCCGVMSTFLPIATPNSHFDASEFQVCDPGRFRRLCAKWKAMDTREIIAGLRENEAVLREIISEAARRLPAELRDRHLELRGVRSWASAMYTGITMTPSPRNTFESR